MLTKKGSKITFFSSESGQSKITSHGESEYERKNPYLFFGGYGFWGTIFEGDVKPKKGQKLLFFLPN